MRWGINLIFPIVITPLLVSTLGLEVFGKIVLTQLLMTYGVTIVDYGYNLIGVKKISVAKNIENSLMTLKII